MLCPGILKICRDMSRGASVMAEHRIPLSSKKYIGGTCTSDTSKLFYLAPILYNTHKSCDSVILSTVHYFINNIRFCCSKVRKRGLFVINHYSDRTLIFNIFAYWLTCDLAKVHSFRNLEILHSIR